MYMCVYIYTYIEREQYSFILVHFYAKCKDSFKLVENVLNICCGKYKFK